MTAITDKKLRYKNRYKEWNNLVADQKRNLPEPDRAGFATTRTGARYINVPHWSLNCNNCKKKGHYETECRQRQNNNRTVTKIIGEVVNEPNESLSKSDESIHHKEEIGNIEENQKHCTAKIKNNGIQKKSIFDTRSPVTKMPFMNG